MADRYFDHRARQQTQGAPQQSYDSWGSLPRYNSAASEIPPSSSYNPRYINRPTTTLAQKSTTYPTSQTPIVYNTSSAEYIPLSAVPATPPTSPTRIDPIHQQVLPPNPTIISSDASPRYNDGTATIPRALRSPELDQITQWRPQNLPSSQTYRNNQSTWRGRGQTHHRRTSSNAGQGTGPEGRQSIGQGASPFAGISRAPQTPDHRPHPARRESNASGAHLNINGVNSAPQPAFIALEPGFKQRPSKFFTVGRVFRMVWDEPGGQGSDVGGSSFTYNSFGQKVYTKPRRFIVVQAHLRSCLVVAITSYSGLGVGKQGVKKSDHCIAYTVRSAPAAQYRELPEPGTPGMQPVAIRIDPDEVDDRLDPMSRIDLATPRKVDHYGLVKNYGKVHPSSLQALQSQFRNVISPSLPALPFSSEPPTMLLSRKTLHLQAYSALVNYGFSQQQAADYVNRNVRAIRNEQAAAARASGDRDQDDATSPSEDET